MGNILLEAVKNISLNYHMPIYNNYTSEIGFDGGFSRGVNNAGGTFQVFK